MKFIVNKDLFPYENRFMDLPGRHRIHYIDEGQGPVLLMLHGNPTWSFLYRKLIAELKDNFRCIAPDLPGFGLSEAPQDYDFSASAHSKVLEDFIKALKIKSFILIGQDWGGPLGLHLATKYPEKVKGAILGNTWAWPLKGNIRFEMFSFINGGSIGRWMANSFNGVWQIFMKRGFSEKPDREELQMYKAPFLLKKNRIQTTIFPKELIKAFEFERQLETNLEKIKQLPVLFTWGTKDFAFKLDALETFKFHFPNHKTVLLDAGHFWQHDQGMLAAKEIKIWYEDVLRNFKEKKGAETNINQLKIYQ